MFWGYSLGVQKAKTFRKGENKPNPKPTSLTASTSGTSVRSFNLSLAPMQFREIYQPRGTGNTLGSGLPPLTEENLISKSPGTLVFPFKPSGYPERRLNPAQIRRVSPANPALELIPPEGRAQRTAPAPAPPPTGSGGGRSPGPRSAPQPGPAPARGGTRTCVLRPPAAIMEAEAEAPSPGTGAR